MQKVNETFKLFPHANPGLMSFEEIKELKKEVNDFAEKFEFYDIVYHESNILCPYFINKYPFKGFYSLLYYK